MWLRIFTSPIQTTCSGVLAEENYIGVRRIILIQGLNPLTNSAIYHCLCHQSECSAFKLINLCKYNLHYLLLGDLNHLCLLTFFKAVCRVQIWKTLVYQNSGKFGYSYI